MDDNGRLPLVIGDLSDSDALYIEIKTLNS